MLAQHSQDKNAKGSLFNTKMHVLLRIGDYIIVRGRYKDYIQCLNKYKNVTVWFIVGINTEIVPHNKCCQVLIVEGTELHWTSAQYLQFYQSTHREAKE